MIHVVYILLKLASKEILITLDILIMLQSFPSESYNPVTASPTAVDVRQYVVRLVSEVIVAYSVCMKYIIYMM